MIPLSWRGPKSDMLRGIFSVDLRGIELGGGIFLVPSCGDVSANECEKRSRPPVGRVRYGLYCSPKTKREEASAFLVAASLLQQSGK